MFLVMRYFHATDAELSPGDVLVPANERGHATKWDNDWYRGDRVYVFDENLLDEPRTEVWGLYVYEVEPEGDVEPDAERGAVDEWDHPSDDPAARSWMTSRATVLAKVF